MDPGKQTQIPELFGAWREYWSKNLDAAEKVLHQTMETEEFAKFVDQQVDWTLTRKQMFNKAMEQYLKETPLPTQADIARVAGLVVNLDAKVDQLELYVEDTVEPMLKAMQDQMTRLESQMAALAELMGEVKKTAQARKRRSSSRTKSEGGETNE